MKYISWISWHEIIGKCDAYLKHNEEVETKLGINVEQELRHGDPYKCPSVLKLLPHYTPDEVA